MFLAVVLDAYSRRVIGWELGRRLHAGLATKALEMALDERTWQPGVLIHHAVTGAGAVMPHVTRKEEGDRRDPVYTWSSGVYIILAYELSEEAASK